MLGAFIRALLLPLSLFLFEFLDEKKNLVMAWGWPEWKVYLTGILWSAFFWSSFILWGAWWTWKSGHRRAVARGFAVLFCSWFFLAYFMSYKYLREMYHLPNVHVVQFTVHEWRNAWALGREALHWWFVPVVFVTILGVSLGLGRQFFKLARWVESLSFRVRTGLFSFLALGLVVCSGLVLGWHRFQEPLPWDANWDRAFFQYGLMLSGNTTNLQTGHRMVLPERPLKGAPNVLIIVNESLRADAIFPEVKLLNSFSDDTLSPRLLARLRDSLCFIFPDAYSNSGATNVSVPSLATGLPPEATTYDFHRYPTFWNIAKSLGYHTFLFTSQDWRWEHLDEFFLDRSVDLGVHRRHFPDAPLANDLGVDDGLVVDSLLKHLAIASRERPFFGAIQFNVNHAPFYGGPASLKLPYYSHERYRSSVHLLDAYTERLLAGLEHLGLYENTLIIYTSDHGENISARHLSRLGSFYDETQRVPFWIKMPRDPALLKSQKESLYNLRQWTKRPVQNLDIMPTLVDFWGLLQEPPLKGLYRGKSLLSGTYDEGRIISGQNTCEIRAWIPEGCFVLRSPLKLVMANHTPPQLFDLSMDPLESKNLWNVDSVRRQNAGWLRDYIRAVPGRLDLCHRLGRNCPVEFQ